MKVVIDGNIGSGKTTQLDLFEAKGYRVRREPIEKWPLEEFYKDPRRWAFYFHMKILQTLRPLKTSKTVIYERSLLSSRWVFWEVLKKKGLVTKGEDEAYSAFYDEFAWYPDLYIFLSKTPELAWEHIRLRNQKGDSGVSIEYWKELDVEYKKLLKIVPCVVHVINANKSVEEIHKEIYSIILEHELLHPHAEREKVQEPSSGRREVSCTPYPDMCCVS